MGYTTKKSLLEAICSGDEVSWHKFYEIYRPLIVVRGRDYKLNVAEIDELEAQGIQEDDLVSIYDFEFNYVR